MNNKNTKFKRGFTLVETLVALSIFTAAIVGLISMTAGGINNVNYAKNKITATWLASEGVEMVRNIRDTYALGTPTGWADFRTAVSDCESSGGCYIDPKTLDVTQCTLGGNNDCEVIKRNFISGVTYLDYDSSGDSTSFTRTIAITSISADEIQIDSIVTWMQGNGEKQVAVREHLFNWFVAITP